MTARYLIGDVFEQLAGIPDDSVDLVLTSPPFLALRSYLPADHPDKAREIGSEPTPAAFIDRLLDLTEEWARVLAPHGSIAVELGDTYSGSGGAGGDYNENGLRAGQGKFKQSGWRDGAPKEGYATGSPDVWRKDDGTDPNLPRAPRGGGSGWPLAKSLCLIPESYRWALVYGRNPFNGRQTPPWRARNVVRWCRPNPPVGALGDKMRPATSDIVIACKSAQRWFDLDAVRERNDRSDETGGGKKRETARVEVGLSSGSNVASGRGIVQNPAGAPPLDHWWHDEYATGGLVPAGTVRWHDDTFPQDAWLISTEPYSGSHYATWPRELCVKPIQAMCPRRVCRTCGQPSRRILGDAEYVRTDSDSVPARLTMRDGERPSQRVNQFIRDDGANTSVTRQAPTLGWTDCGHDDWRPGVVLDPFAGSGTTLAVATGHGRDAIGIDLDGRNAELARERVGMFLTIDEPPQTVNIATNGRL